jgi:uncharacterized protein (TIGR03790 family)
MNSKSCIKRLLIAAVLLLVYRQPCALFALTPDQVAVVANKNDGDSLKVAEFYMRVRNIPDRNLVVLDLPLNTDTITPDFYKVHIAQAIRDDLRQLGLAGSIHCLAVIYGVPLRVGAASIPPSQNNEISNLRTQVVDCEQQIELGTQQLQAPDFILVPATQTSNSTGSESIVFDPSSTTVELFISQFKSAVQDAITKIHQAPPDQLDQLSHRFLDIMTRYIGFGGVAEMLRTNGNSAAEDTLEQERQEVTTALAEYKNLSTRRDLLENRQRMQQVQRQYFGVLGLMQELSSEIVFLSQLGGPSAVDNDLMMLWYPDDNHNPWTPNPMCIDTWNNQTNGTPPILMVSRLDAPSPNQVIGMIQSSLNVEARGLSGVAYFDARGLTSTDAYGNMDQDLRRAAHLIQINTNMKVVLDNTPALLAAANCPDAAIYCGWYSVHHYVDSCQWLPGCVAYHVASYELSTLHNAQDPGWCVNLIERGVTGTLGAVDEPYLFAFPNPSEFFPLLLSGRFTQAEVYYLTTPMVGWRIAYVGDPLYNPFKNNPIYPLDLIRQDPILGNALRELPK